MTRSRGTPTRTASCLPRDTHRPTYAGSTASAIIWRVHVETKNSSLAGVCLRRRQHGEEEHRPPYTYVHKRRTSRRNNTNNRPMVVLCSRELHTCRGVQGPSFEHAAGALPPPSMWNLPDMEVFSNACRTDQSKPPCLTGERKPKQEQSSRHHTPSTRIVVAFLFTRRENITNDGRGQSRQPKLSSINGLDSFTLCNRSDNRCVVYCCTRDPCRACGVATHGTGLCGRAVLQGGCRYVDGAAVLWGCTSM